MEASRGWSPFARQCYVTAAVCITIVGHGCSAGYPAVLLPQVTAGNGALELDKDQASWTASAMAMTIVCGNLVSPVVMESWGRRAALLLVSVPAVAGWLVAAGATSFAVRVGQAAVIIRQPRLRWQELIASRLLLGFSFGMSLPLRSVLIGEYTSPRNRGAFLTTVALAQASGIFLVHLTGSIWTWQVTALVCSFYPFVSLVMAIFCPESPSFLAAKGRYDESRKVFRWLRGSAEEEELEELIQARIELKELSEESDGFSFKEILVTCKKKEFYKPIFIMTCANVMMQFAGGTTMAAYSPVIIGMVVGSDVDANFWMLFLDAQRIFSNTLAIYFLNRFKRRTMIVTFASVCVLSHLAISGYIYGRDAGMLFYQANWIPLVLLNLQFFTVAAGMVPLPNVIAGEIFPLQYKSIGGCISIIFISVSSFAVLKTFPTMTGAIGIDGTFVVFACIMAFLMICIWLTMPETKGKTLQQIEDEFTGRQEYVAPENDRLQHLEKLRKRKMSVVSTMSLAIEM